MLTEAQIKKAKATEKPYKLSDSKGLFLLVSNSGSKLWRFRYQRDGKEHLLSLGSYPDLSLSDARDLRDEKRKIVKSGGDPKLAPIRLPSSVSGLTFETLAREWFELQRPMWVKRHADDVIDSLESRVFPHIGSKHPDDISAPDVLKLLREIEKTAIETAKRVRQRISSVYVYGISSGQASNDPAHIVKGALAPLRKSKQPAVITLKEAREVLSKAEAETAHPVTKLAMRLLALTAVRPGTLITTPWTEFADLDKENPVWHIPASRMKLKLEHKDDARRDHLVPLSKQAIEVIEAAKKESWGATYVFPNVRHRFKPMSENALSYLLKRAHLSGVHVPHGWRSTFSTIMNEHYPNDRAVIDLMLAHVPKDKVEAAYNRAMHLGRRRELAQLWADLLMNKMAPAGDLLLGPKR
ncbi:tyrosine-type recombinase/integrase [Brucella rhizosphaerae]|uniref:tyrosine-type recombinase/integrase n=1 Tax=Brucella rhizosphaerae TaxID=571254 RepID=UPI000467CDEB|nr:integrase arm-type DNA-binding domain-containing protein [Brucella rhizosphaerae]